MARSPEQMSGSLLIAMTHEKAIDDGEAHSIVLAYSNRSSYEKSIEPSLDMKVV